MPVVNLFNLGRSFRTIAATGATGATGSDVMPQQPKRFSEDHEDCVVVVGVDDNDDNDDRSTASTASLSTTSLADSTSTSTSTSTSRSSDGTGVRFAETTTVFVGAVLHMDDYTVEERRACFMTLSDVRRIREENRATIDSITMTTDDIMDDDDTIMMMDKVKNDNEDDDDYYCIRGLEGKTRMGKRQRREIRYTSVMSVLDAQCLKDYYFSCSASRGSNNKNTNNNKNNKTNDHNDDDDDDDDQTMKIATEYSKTTRTACQRAHQVALNDYVQAYGRNANNV